MKTINMELGLPNPAQPLNCEWEGAVHTHFSKQAQRVPQQLAVIDAQVAWNYAELDAKSNQLANYLRENGIQSQDIVAIYSHRSAALIWAILGILKAGAAFVILDPAYPASRLINCLHIAQPRGWLQLEIAGELPDELDKFVKTLSCCCSLQLSQQAMATDELLSAYSTSDPMIAVEPDNLLYIAFTSGSTGIPKGILGTHRPLSHFIKWHGQTFGFNESDRFSMLSGLAHDPLLRDIFTPLSLGATLCIPSPQDIQTPGKLADWMHAQQVSITHLTPPMGQLITNITPTSRTQNGSLTSLRYAFFGGDKLKKQDIFRLRSLAPNVTCVNFYGATETPQAMGYFVVPNSDEPTNLNQSIPVGRGIQDVQLLILNAEQQLVEIGEVGEIYIRTHYLAKGYIGDEQLTDEKYIINPYTNITGDSDTLLSSKDRCYRTGDLGRYLPDGNVECLGRSDNQVKIRGFRIEVEEIEAVLREHPNLRETVVIARENDLGDKRLVAYVVSDQVIPISELRRLIQDKLPEYMIPSAFVRLETLPLTPNGKIDRRALPAPEAVKQEPKETFVTLRTDLELQLTKIWQKVLGVQHIGIKDNFFELGGHSLLAIQLFAEIEQITGSQLPIATLLQAPTIEELACLLRQSGGVVPWSSLVAIQPNGSKLPLFCIHPIGGNVLEYLNLVRYFGSEQPVYGLQAIGLDQKQTPLKRVEDMAAHYIKEIRTIQPQGPYLLAGFSFGGSVAYEMAHQLHHQGQKVSLLAMFDTPSPNLQAHKLSFVNTLFMRLGHLWQLAPTEKLGYVQTIVRWYFNKGEYKDYLRRQLPEELQNFEVLDSNMEASKNYVPPVYPGSITIFRCSIQDPKYSHDHSLGWSDLVSGVEVHNVPSYHDLILRKPHVQVLAEKLKICIEKAQA